MNKSTYGSNNFSYRRLSSTCGKTRVLDTNYWITTVSAYDEKAREIYSYSNNPYLESTDILYTELGYVGNILKTIHEHDKDNEDLITIEDNYSYDHTGRLLKQTQTISQAGGINEVVITENEYDELGQLVKKGLGGQNSQNRLQYLDYKYNIRGWLTNINDVFHFDSDLFAENIRYEKPNDPNVTKKYNGNISEIIWMTANDYKGRTYTYEYDALDRISEANYYMAFEQSLEDYSLSNISYDKNGNIYSLERMGYYPDTDTYDLIDVLTYEYEETSNKLSSVSDTAGVLGFDDQNTTGDDYDYDENGNMVIDNNKSIQNITYNHLNLPTLIDFGNSNKIEYFYNAAGIKLKKVVTDNGNITTTKYNGGFVYVDDELQYIKQSEGYIEPNYTGGFKHIFQLEDHLGNVRISFQHNTSESTSLEEIFEYNTGSWTPTNNDNVIINNNNGELNLSIKEKWHGINKYIDIIPNTPVHIEFDFNKGTMESTTFFVQERINGNWEVQGEYDVFPNLSHGRFKTDLVLSGDAIRLKFEKANRSDDGIFTICYIDNFIFYQNSIDIVEENNYYPFGLKHQGYNNLITSTNPALKYKYNGKELQDELDLNWYDYGARNYDPALGRWMNIDPLGEKFVDWSLYTYAIDNPIYFIDPDGKIIEPYRTKWLWGYFYTYPNFGGNMFGSHGATFHDIKESMISDSSTFKRIYTQLEKSENTYRFVEKNTTKFGVDRAMQIKRPLESGYFTANNGTITFVSNSEHGIQGFKETSTIFEEVFHAGQYDYYGKDNTLSQIDMEVEAKVAKAVEGYGDFTYEGFDDFVKGLKKGNLTNDQIGLFQMNAENYARRVSKNYIDYWTGNGMDKDRAIELYGMDSYMGVFDYFQNLYNVNWYPTEEIIIGN